MRIDLLIGAFSGSIGAKPVGRKSWAGTTSNHKMWIYEETYGNYRGPMPSRVKRLSVTGRPALRDPSSET